MSVPFRFAALVAVLSTAACGVGREPVPPDLRQGARVIRDMVSVEKLRAAGFFEAYPDPKPSDWMSFVQSELGVVLWPPREDGPFASELEIEQSRAIGETVIPAGLTFSAERPDTEKARQIVFRADDATGEIVVEGYVDPNSAPVFTERWSLPNLRL